VIEQVEARCRERAATGRQDNGADQEKGAQADANHGRISFVRAEADSKKICLRKRTFFLKPIMRDFRSAGKPRAQKNKAHEEILVGLASFYGLWRAGKLDGLAQSFFTLAAFGGWLLEPFLAIWFFR
jgi:hypothetical protein